jgi:hypothetical protein
MRLFWALALCGVAVLISAGCTKANRTHQGFQSNKKRIINADAAPLIAGKRNKVFHVRHCPYASNLESLIGFPSARDAEISGYLPCEFCNPYNVELPEPELKKEK